MSSQQPTLLEVQFLLQRIIMGKSEIMMGKMEEMQQAISSLREENQVLKDEVLTVFVWDNYRKLATKVLGREISEQEFRSSCRDNVSINVLNSVMYAIKRKHGLIKASTNFAQLPLHIQSDAQAMLEAKAAPFLPLAACTKSWGGRKPLIRYWRRRSQQYMIKEESENGDEEDHEQEYENAVEEAEKQEEEICLFLIFHVTDVSIIEACPKQHYLFYWIQVLRALLSAPQCLTALKRKARNQLARPRE
ncbi:hypothetical protein EDC96DRAFT_540632 [Choanephora cucurbitarum]|nr:hypothetical protein EDC96DRAFT_540632 [Choanephora cucurbitarum]